MPGRLPHGYRSKPFPLLRRLSIDAARAGRGRHAIHGLIEVDITEARRRLRAMAGSGRSAGSMTAYVVANVARAAARHPQAHAFKDWRGRMVLADRVHVATLVETEYEGETMPLVHLVRNADRRGVDDLSADLQRIKADPTQDPLAPLLPYLGLFLRLPGPARTGFYRLLARSPTLRERLAGTVTVTAVGMFASGGGWGVSFPTIYSMGVVVGGIARKPTVIGDHIEPRDLLALTLTFDHDVIDGAPAARFARDLVRMLESAEVLGLPVTR